MTKYLYAAFFATWAIHIFYIATLAVRATSLRKEWDELRGLTKDGKQRSSSP